MEVTEHALLEIRDTSSAGHARRMAVDLAEDIGFPEAEIGRLGIVVTEAATNLVKHGGGGELLLRTLGSNGTRGIGLLALDRGPGFANLAEAMRDGFSSAGTPGTGLGAIRRLSTMFDIYSIPGAGAALMATVWPGTPPAQAPGLLASGINVAYPGEQVSGDAWALRITPERTVVFVSDGLGHGAIAAAASEAAIGIFRERAGLRPPEILEYVHEGLRPTRGAAVAITEIDRGQGVIRFAGIGNIAGTILLEGRTWSLVSHHGTAGHDVRRIQEFSYPWPSGATLVLHSDGLVSHWTLDHHPGLATRHPMLVAGILYRDFCRGRDDTTVVVLREAS
ncbi:MAG TPA: ATP-binding SpoIIE family protein phosphatase [Candidatus Binatia bacterium]|nr:ATP-binding SpoIIE family protein phosphatase [Candidatus Binatia bacterium]